MAAWTVEVGRLFALTCGGVFSQGFKDPARYSLVLHGVSAREQLPSINVKQMLRVIIYLSDRFRYVVMQMHLGVITKCRASSSSRKMYVKKNACNVSKQSRVLHHVLALLDLKDLCMNTRQN